MPAINEIRHTRDEEVLLIVERDIPELHEKMTNLDQKQNDIEGKVNECIQGISSLSGKMDIITIEVKSIKDRDQLPFYKDFNKVLILLFALGFMAVAGVKGANTLLGNLGPSMDIAAEAIGG